MLWIHPLGEVIDLVEIHSLAHAELAGVPEDLAREAARLASMKLPVKTKFVKREVDLFEG